MSASLRPMTLGEILDRTFHIYRQRFWPFVALGAVASTAILAVKLANQLWLKIEPSNGFSLFAMVNVGWLFFIIGFFHINRLLELFTYPSLTHLASGQYVHEPCTLAKAMRAFKAKWGRNLGLPLVTIALVLLLPEALLILLFTGVMSLADALRIETNFSGPVWEPAMTCVLVGGFIAYYWMTSWFALAWSAAAVEGMSLKCALDRSHRISRGARWRIIVARVLPTLLWLVLTISAILALRVAMAFLHRAGMNYFAVSRTFEISLGFAKWGFTALLTPLFPVALTLIYYDQRIRKEGFDIEWMMQSAGMTETALQTPAASEVTGA